MPRRAVRALRVGDSENLSSNYWKLRDILWDRNFKVDDYFDTIYSLEEHELVYLYWELVYTKSLSPLIKMNVRVFKDYLVDEFMNRKYKRGRYSEKSSKNAYRAHYNIQGN